MSLKLTLLFIVLMLLGTCGKSAEQADSHTTTNQAVTAANMQAAPQAPPSSLPLSSPVETSQRKNTDNSTRAIGQHPDGRLLVKPASKASVTPLGAPSCYGQETDLSWSGDYEAVWESKSDGSSSRVMTFPADFEIIQRDDTPVEMQMFTVGGTDILSYVPRYTDCHARETYFFGVEERKAFPIRLELNRERILNNIGQLPNRLYKVTRDELVLTGGYGAGQDFIDVYHFRFDLKKRTLILQSTDHVEPNDIMYDE